MLRGCQPFGKRSLHLFHPPHSILVPNGFLTMWHNGKQGVFVNVSAKKDDRQSPSSRRFQASHLLCSFPLSASFLLHEGSSHEIQGLRPSLLEGDTIGILTSGKGGFTLRRGLPLSSPKGPGGPLKKRCALVSLWGPQREWLKADKMSSALAKTQYAQVGGRN